MSKRYFIEELQIPIDSNIPSPSKNRRAQIVKSLKNHLAELNYSIEVFEIYVFDKDNLPLIVIKDTEDNIEVAALNRIKHELSVSVNIITSSYTQNDEILTKTLDRLKEFDEEFNYMNLSAINRSNIEVLDKDYVMTEIKIEFVYQTDIWRA